MERPRYRASTFAPSRRRPRFGLRDRLRDLLRDGLRDAPLHELQALLAGLDARVAPAASGAAGAAPVMRVAVPIAR